jgi:hypothetical protein
MAKRQDEVQEMDAREHLWENAFKFDYLDATAAVKWTRGNAAR